MGLMSLLIMKEFRWHSLEMGCTLRNTKLDVIFSVVFVHRCVYSFVCMCGVVYDVSIILLIGSS